ncbi:MAG: DUF4105 domain-containing protein [Xanthomonadales bacterium]|nr:DUF4105 domain-containing protein [Xanthomonadales bacterium]
MSVRWFALWVLYGWLGLVGGAFTSPPAAAQESLPPPTGPEAWLVTYGPGEIYWQRFGHNAIWLREPGGLDHAFNFGFFDFEQENFLLRFVQGRMRYFAAAVPAEQEIDFYAREGRSVRMQRLNISPEGFATLREYLVRHVQPENREYLYDYYRDNCSTRLRDALDLALGGAFRERFQARPAEQNLRAHTRRSTQLDRAYYLGLVAALGLPIDRAISRWDEMFLPAVLADSVVDHDVIRNGDRVPLVLEDRVLVPSQVALPPDKPGRTWPIYGSVGLLLVVIIALLGRSRRPAAVAGFAYGWLLVAGTLGLGLAAAWAFTDHHDAFPNLNLLLLNPLGLLAVLPALRRFAGGALLVSVGAAVVAAVWPGGQYLADTLALLAPINLAVAAWLLRSRQTSQRLSAAA